ncbi:MAG: HAD-IC family P-type ATPase [Clostridia bacterium]|nr:HAD-IC family P-type ATPase [Clostridia bacterium]
MKKKQKNQNIKSVSRYNPKPDVGLTLSQVKKRTDDGLLNVSKLKTSKTLKSIFFKNIFTFFNMTCLAVALALIYVGAFSDLLFLVIVILNTCIGIIQEIKAKKTVDKLSLTNSNFTKVIRDGEEEEIYKTELVLDDVLCLNIGMQIACDSIVLEGNVEVNESLLTGESQPVKKKKGDMLLGGSFISSGTCKAKVNKIGDDNYIAELSKKAKSFKQTKSELLTSLRTLIKGITVFMVPVAIIMAYNNYKYYHATPDPDYSLLYMVITKTSGCIVAMIPAGMFLLTSVALAVSVVRLAKKRTLVQDLYCIEMLARTDVLCLDKTGTLTNGSMSVKELVMLDKSKTEKDTSKIISSIVNTFHDANNTAMALKSYFGKGVYSAEKSIPFSSERKFMGCKFRNIGAFKIGAYEFVMDNPSEEIKLLAEKYASEGLRVLLLGESDASFSNKGVKPIALILLQDNVRKDAPRTIEWFKKNGVDIKIISGDNPVTVSEVARRVGVENADKYISLYGLNEKEVIEAADKYAIFGRVSPEQKAILVKAIKSKGKTVAMTGDGVNDILALKEADCSIAIAAGSDAARSVSQLVLLDSNFSSMPSVVAEGRRVVNNIQKSSSLFLMKTMFAICISIFVLCMGETYPFSPIQFILLEMFVIGIPSFCLALQPNTNKIKGHFLSNLAKNTLPAGTCLVVSTIAMYLYKMFADITTPVLVTMCSIAVIVVGFIALFRMCKPFNGFKGFVFIFCALICASAILFFPGMFKYVSLSYTDTLFLIVVCQFAFPLYVVLNKIFEATSSQEKKNSINPEQ